MSKSRKKSSQRYSKREVSKSSKRNSPRRKAATPIMRQVTLYANFDDPFCGEIVNLLETAGINLQVHDIKKRPLDSDQISGLIKHFDVERFLNPYSKPYKRNKLGGTHPSRQEVIDLLASDNELFRVPIVVSGSMISVGFDPRQIAGMLQIKPGNSESDADKDAAASGKDRALPIES